MASSPETGPPPENTHMSSPPLFPPAPPIQETPPPTTADPLEPAQSDHANLTPPPPPGQATAKSPEAYKPAAPHPIDGNPRGAGPPPSLSPRELATSASPALETAKLEEPTSPSPPPPVEVSPEAASTAASPPPMPQIAAASPEDAPPPSSSPSPTTSTSGALPDTLSTDSVAMASEEAARPPPALESMDADLHTAPAPPTPPSEVGSEELLTQQHPRPPSPTAHPVCENSEHAQLPPPPPPPAETTHTLPDAAEAVAVTSEEAAVSPPLALDTTDGETDNAPVVPLAFENDAEGSFQEPVPVPPSRPMEAEPCSPEMAPPGFENFKSPWPPLPPPTLPITITHSLLDAAAIKAKAVLEQEAMDAEIDTAPGLPMPSSGSRAEGPLQQPLLRPPSPMTQAEPCSPDMPPPGFENFKSSWLPPPTLPSKAEITRASSDVVATKTMAVTIEEAAWPVPALQPMDVEIDTARSLLPPLESRVEGLFEHSLLRPPTPMKQSAPCSPEMAPPGFENFKSSWPPLSTPLSGTAYVLPDAAATEPLAVMLEEVAGPPPALEATHSLLLPLQSRVEGSLQELHPRPPSPTMQDAPCSPDMAPPGFENFKSSQVLLPSQPLAQTAYTLHDPATTEAVYVSEEAALPPPALEAMVVNMDTSPSQQPSSENGAEGSLPQQLPTLPSPKEKGTACSPEMVPSGHENLQSLQLLQPPALLPQVQTPDALADVVATEAAILALEEVHHPPPVLGTKEEGAVPILPPSLESSSEGLLPKPEPHTHSLAAHAVDTPPDSHATNSMAVKSEETAQPPPALQATTTNMDSATTSLQLSESGADGSLPQLQHQPSSPTAQTASCSLDSLQMLPPPPPPFLNKEMGQMVCGYCRDLLAYPRGAVHVQCASCRTINLVLEAHEVGNVHCGRCEVLLMYPFGAPAVKCCLCLFVTEIGERNVRPRISVEQVVPPHTPEVTNQG